MADYPTRIDLGGKTRNLRHRTLIAKLCQYLQECIRSGSGNEPMVDAADFNRLTDYLDDIQAIIGSLNIAGAVLTNNSNANARPEIDTPLTRDDWWDLAEPVEVPLMENVFWMEMCERISKSIREMKDAQSALFSNAWHPSDPPRWTNYIAAIRYDMATVVGTIEPIDQPLTSPQQQPVFDNIGSGYNTDGASNAVGNPNRN